MKNIYIYINNIRLVAAASGSKKTAEYMRSFNIGAQLCLLFKLSKETYFSMRYISLLQIIERTSRADKETSEAYLNTKNAKDSLFKDIQLEIMVNFINFLMILISFIKLKK